ncbi:CBO0543 family protein [Paenibacillus flagellatus]|uniref:Uncharacterized protein n=1 Tax=Paenibacillus flagellatus TaxID=2211139 RepID=A0A2V5KBZ0_9BACL|nr:CBO0543 family protein [Paenibacillus flagellatus]PYI56502.1 hypothetical protein DLM86_05890 [Paenibacillus flagellatus]
MSFYSWKEQDLFTWPWWFELGVVVVPWVLFFLLLDRKRSLSVWFFGLFVLIVTAFLDDLGAEAGLWSYPVKFVPYSLIAMPFDFSPVPVAQMLIYQYVRSWKPFLLALVGQALLFAYVGEPFSVWVKAVEYDEWNYSYSFLFYIVLGTAAKAFVDYWVRKQAGEGT